MDKIIIAVVITLAAAVPLTWLISSLYRKKVYEKKVGTAEEKSREILDEAMKTAKQKKREALLEAKEEALKAKNEFEKE